MAETDSKKPDEYISAWKRGKPIHLRGSKKPYTQNDRPTDLYLKIEDTDVIALFYALLERYQEKGPALASPDIIRICAVANSRVANCLLEVLQSKDHLEEAVAAAAKAARRAV